MTFATTAILMLVSLLIGGGLVFFLKRRLNKKQVAALTEIKISEGQDKDRDNLINRAEAVIKKNKKLLEKLKKET